MEQIKELTAREMEQISGGAYDPKRPMGLWQIDNMPCRFSDTGKHQFDSGSSDSLMCKCCKTCYMRGKDNFWYEVY